MQCDVVAVLMAAGRDMMIVGRRDRRRMYEGRAADGGINCSYCIELIVLDCSIALVRCRRGDEVTDGGVIVGQRLCGEWKSTWSAQPDQGGGSYS
jgi:hypothetical protein